MQTQVRGLKRAHKLMKRGGPPLEVVFPDGAGLHCSWNNAAMYGTDRAHLRSSPAMSPYFRPASILLVMVLASCGSDESNNSTSLDTDVMPDMGSRDVLDDAEFSDADMTPDPPSVDQLFEQGPHPVGFVEFEVSYIAPGGTGMRVLPMKAWYPAVPDSGAAQARYAVAGIVDVPTEIARDSPAAADGEFPVAVYSHGSGGEGLLAYPYGEHFASWGWIMVAPNHVGNTALDLFLGDSAPFIANVLYRVTDISAVLDAVESEATGTSFDGHADIEEVLLFGHSFGGYTTFAAGGATYDYDATLALCPTVPDDGSCALLVDPDVEAAFRAGFGDDRIDAIVSQAPALVPQFANGEIGSIDIPTMIQSGDLDTTTPTATQAEPAWNTLNGASDVWLRIPTGAHFTFITICHDLTEQLLLMFRPNANQDGCGPTYIDTREAVPILNAYIRAFAETHVRDREGFGAFLDGTEALDDRFTVTTR